MLGKTAQISDVMAKRLLYILKHLIFERIYDLKVIKNDTKNLKPPYLLLANHVNILRQLLKMYELRL
ncbi:hypothetical protein IMX26_06540 [Clostridium sp. 'deep sea']|uniref:hypothetical protein n=1 Tax=Clostridium sp. 'deep sea' TaxID=2779445 RepID=UPI0018967A02|nr:hypothetical protein [Clostridium sp. 'deep sea']QOR36463.1 hypothetical protein IMX26_06540 [Clostridium sp. 'deep sea']